MSVMRASQTDKGNPDDAPDVIAIVPAAGIGKRFSSTMPKQYTTLGEGEKPVLAWVLEALEAHPRVRSVIPVVRKDDLEALDTIVRGGKYVKILPAVIGGKERQDSVYNALKSISEPAPFIMVHDAVRPFLTQELITRCIEGIAEGYDGTIAAVPPKDTIKQGEGHIVKATLERATLWSVQTPQTFRAEILFKAYQDAMKKGIYSTDDSALVEAIGGKVRIVDGYYENIKVTTPEDKQVGDAIIDKGFMD